MTDQSDLELAERMRAVTGAFVRRVRQGAGTPSDARLASLAYLERQGRPLSAAELARWRGVTHQTTRVLLLEMTADGLVHGNPDPNDARAILFALTAKGLDTLARSREARAGWIADRWISALTTDEKTALRMVIDAMIRLEDVRSD